MALSAFDDRKRPPTPADVNQVLGTSKAHWDMLIRHVADEHAPISEQWNFAGEKFGWSLRLKQKERIILYLTPQSGVFLAGIVLGEKAAKAARARGSSETVLALIAAAPRYAEGRGIRLSVASSGDLQSVQQLVSLKLGP